MSDKIRFPCVAAGEDNQAACPATNTKPYCSIGAGQLTAFLWKDGDRVGGARYRFNAFRLLKGNGKVSQSFRPADLKSFAKLIQVLTALIADDGCLEDAERRVVSPFQGIG